MASKLILTCLVGGRVKAYPKVLVQFLDDKQIFHGLSFIDVMVYT